MFPASAPTRGQLLMLDGEAGAAPIAVAMAASQGGARIRLARSPTWSET
jgi:hypothetical protein